MAVMRGKGSVRDAGQECPMRIMTRDLTPIDIDLSPAYRQDSDKAMIREAASILRIDPEKICFVWRSVRTKSGEKRSVFNFISRYNPDFNELLKETGQASFSRQEKLWSIPQDTFLEFVREEMSSDFFSVIIDLDDEACFRTTVAGNADTERRYYDLLPSPVTVRVADLIEAYGRERPHDEVIGRGLRVFDGQRLVSPGSETFATRHPFLLLRFSVKARRPRHVVVSTLSGEIEAVLFERNASMGLARFHEACNALNEPVMAPALTGRAASLETVSGLIRERMRPALDAVERLSQVLTDLDVSIVPLEYHEIIKGDGMQEPILAKVLLREGALSEGIARMTGQNGARNIIMSLAHMDARDSRDIEITIIHEVAHHLAIENETFGFDDHHGKEFGIMFAALARAAILPLDSINRHLCCYFPRAIADSIISAVKTLLLHLEMARTRQGLPVVLTCADIRDFLGKMMMSLHIQVLSAASLPKNIPWPKKE